KRDRLGRSRERLDSHRDQGTHLRHGLDGDDARAGRRKQPRQLAGAGREIEDLTSGAEPAPLDEIRDGGSGVRRPCPPERLGAAGEADLGPGMDYVAVTPGAVPTGGAPASSSGIVGWSPRQCGRSLSCTIRRNRKRTIDAARTAKPITLTIAPLP